MKIAVLSDIHSNNIALMACMDYIEQQAVDGVIFLGDNVSDCPDPQTTLALIGQMDQTYRTWHINGNREEYFLGRAAGIEPYNQWTYSSEKGSLLYTYERLTKEDLALFRTRSNQDLVQIAGTEPIRIVHGSPKHTRELLYPATESADFYLEQSDAQYLLCGHTHRQYAYEKGGRLLLNPGSVGVAIGVRHQAHMSMLEWEDSSARWRYDLCSVPFDYQRLCELFYGSELMEKAKLWPRLILKSMETGVNYAPLCAVAAYEMAVSAGVTITGRGVPEQYWQQAAQSILA